MNPEKTSSACVSFSSSLLVAVDDPQSASELLDLRDVTLDLCFGVSRCFLMSLSQPYPIPKSLAHIPQKANLSPQRNFLTQLYFVAHPLLNETK